MKKFNVRICCLCILLFVLIYMFSMFNINLSSSSSVSLYSDTNAPEFYGLTKAVIKLGDDFDFNDARYRVFARDFEDGDLTQSINILGDVDTSKVGIYMLDYTVIDSHNNSSHITVSVEVVDDVTINRYYERTLYSLPSVWNMEMVGTNRGNNHDRQMLGFYMEVGSEIKVKKISGSSDLTLTYLNNDSHNEKNFTISSDLVTITSTYSGVPFIKTSYDSDVPVVIGVEVMNDVGVKELPYYRDGDDEICFFNKWSNSVDSFSVVESEDLTVLVPYSDKNLLLKTGEGNFDTLADFMDYWSKVIDKYDAYLGLSYNPSEAIDQNVKTKYFVKANKHGAGLAYYAGDHVGYNSSSVAGFFNMGWAGLHELAHGYQGSLAYQGIDQGEVSNNIIGHYVQMDKSFYTASYDWLGDISTIESKYNDLRKSGIGYDNYESYGYQGRLYILVNLLDTYNSEETYAKINKIYRRAVYNKNKLSAGDVYALAFYELYNVNVSFYLESFGIEVSDDIKYKISGSDILYFLDDLVNDEVLSEEIRLLLDKKGLYSLISNRELRNFNLKSNVSVSLSIDDFTQLYGRKISIVGYDGKSDIIIDDKNIFLNDMNVGVYEIKVPCPKNNIYEYNESIFLKVVNNYEHHEDITYTKNESDTLILDDIFYFKGLGNWTFANMQFEEDNIILTTNGGMPHSYFTDSYASVKIVDSNENLLFERNYVGNIAYDDEKSIIPVEVGYKILVTHREASSRLEVWSRHLQEENLVLSKPKSTSIAYIVDKYGVYLDNDISDKYEDFQKKIDDYAGLLTRSLTEQEVSNKNMHSKRKRVLFTSILKLEETDKIEYLEKYKPLYNGAKPMLNYDTITVNQFDSVNFYSLLKGTDIEDGIFGLTVDNFVFGLFDTNNAGSFVIPYLISDLDENVTKGNILIVVNPKEILPDDEESSECPDDSSDCDNVDEETNNIHVGNNLINKNEGTSINKTDKNDEYNDFDDEIIDFDKEYEVESTSDSYSDEIIIDIYVVLFIITILIIFYLKRRNKNLKNTI